MREALRAVGGTIPTEQAMSALGAVGGAERVRDAQRLGRVAERTIYQLATVTGWLVFHVGDSRRQVKPGVWVGDKGAKGFPDFLFVHPLARRFLIREVKTGQARLSREQKEWIAALKGAGVDAGVWRWPDDRRLIEATLNLAGSAPAGGGQPRAVHARPALPAHQTRDPFEVDL